MEWHEILAYILSGLAILIPLTVKLVKYMKKAIKEKNWCDMLALVIDLMQDAEDQFENGADRKQWVLNMVESSASMLDYEIDIEQVGRLIDALCSMAKVVNVAKK